MSLSEPKTPRPVWAVLALMFAFVAFTCIPMWGWTYWDFGDGNYLYIARRVNEGLTLYKEILAPQPPLHVLGGALSMRVGEAFGNGLFGVRAYCLLLRLGAGLMVFLVAKRYFRCATIATVATAFYFALPIGFWWSMGYQSENLEIPLLLFAVWQLLAFTKRNALHAGIASGLAMHVNMTAAPYFLVNATFLACRRRDLLVPYVVGALGVWGLGAVTASVMTDGYYLNNVVLNQVGTFPRTDILSASRPGYTFADYVIEKVPREAMRVIGIEGALILAACAGLALRVSDGAKWAETSDDESRHARLTTEFLAWSSIGMWLSICFTAKGGTVNYIFVIGEPAVALFAADAIVRLTRRALHGIDFRNLSFGNTQPFLRVLFPLLTLAMMWVPSADNIKATLREVQTELPEDAVLEIRDLIAEHARPGDTILAPPFYAFLSNTRVAGELSENYIWQIKYQNERFDNEEGLAVRKMEEIALMLESQSVALLLLDMGQTGRIPEIERAAERFYVEIPPGRIFTRNTELRVMIPRNSANQK